MRVFINNNFGDEKRAEAGNQTVRHPLTGLTPYRWATPAHVYSLFCRLHFIHLFIYTHDRLTLISLSWTSFNSWFT